jgi:cytochrome b
MSPEARPVLVWDLATRGFHWLMVLLVSAAYVTWRLNWMAWHVYAGDAVLALVLFRLAWGVAGSDTARFAHFLAPPRAALRHLLHVFRREPDEQLGHNAAGGWMVMLLLALLLGQTLTGILVNNDVADEGPLTELLPAWLLNLFSALHSWLWNALLAAITLHLAAIAIYALVKGQNLVRPMVTGRKTLPQRVTTPHFASPVRAVLLLCGSAAIAALLARFL